MASFNDFLLSEYEHIADAHFETGKQVSVFFRYYLLILAAPIIIFTIVKDAAIYDSIFAPSTNNQWAVHWIAFWLLLVISVFGFLMCIVVINLQHNSTLYARTVNGIRKYFYEQELQNPEVENGIRVLPKNVQRPDFRSARHLGIIVTAFAVINSSFLCGAIIIYEKGVYAWWIAVWFVSYLTLHFLWWLACSRIRERKPLR